MGLFDRLFGMRGPEFTERIWLTTAGKLGDIVDQVRANIERGIYPIVVVHFRKSLKLLLDVLRKSGIRVQTVESSVKFPAQIADQSLREAPILVMLSEAIPASAFRSELVRPKDPNLSPLSVHLAEHYPLHPRDQQVLELDRAWPMEMAFTCYTALDEPWLKPFGVERILQIMGRLGVDEKTVLSHPLLNRSIQNAQQMLSRQVNYEQSCYSCDEWMQVNTAGRINR